MQKYNNVTVWYEFLAGIAKIYQPRKGSFTKALSRVLVALQPFRHRQLYQRLKMFGYGLSHYDKYSVLSTGIEDLKDMVQTDLYNMPKRMQIAEAFLDNLHQILLGNQHDYLAEFIKQFRQVR